MGSAHAHSSEPVNQIKVSTCGYIYSIKTVERKGKNSSPLNPNQIVGFGFVEGK